MFSVSSNNIISSWFKKQAVLLFSGTSSKRLKFPSNNKLFYLKFCVWRNICLFLASGISSFLNCLFFIIFNPWVMVLLYGRLKVKLIDVIKRTLHVHYCVGKYIFENLFIIIMHELTVFTVSLLSFPLFSNSSVQYLVDGGF